ncbi:MAG: glycosyltransferase family 2 protein [Candidatus Shapirobacteria bacterium]
MTKNKPLISAVINIHNEVKTLEKCLRSIRGFADEIIIIDMESTDNGAEIAKNFNAKVISHRFVKYVEPVRNFALSKTTGKWVLILDPDEYLNTTLKKELLRVTQRKDVDFVRIPRKNLVFGRWLRHSNMWPDYLVRFFKNGHVSWKKEIHSQPTTKGNGLNLLDSEKLAIRHQNYPSINSFIQRAVRYSSVQAEELMSTDYKLKTSDFILKPIQEFNSRFFRGEGFKDGLHGLIFCLLQAFAICLIYIRLWEKTGSPDKPLAKDSFVSAAQEANFEFNHWFSWYYIKENNQNFFKNFFIRFRQFINRLTKNL